MGWIFSNKELSFFNLEKSSIYFRNANKTVIIKRKKDKNIEKKDINRTINYSDIILAITLIKKIEIYFEVMKKKKKIPYC